MQMPFAIAVQKCLSNYVTFSGRAQRSEYWWFVLFVILVCVAAAILDNLLGITFNDDGDGPIQSLVGLAILLPMISVAVRRLHDTDRSGWWWWIQLVPIVGFFVFLYFACSRGTEGPNRFGLDPLRRGSGDGGSSGGPRFDPADFDDALTPSRVPNVPRD
ncbi:DUF805 domain-containing protein [Cognatishimia sp. MH4019]|uniref:DUF805 domain-containing protein n=1 Tax=Cognatishimia sp. MH4019 TaxID=2854030 RepID=UPI001CD31202|nr:DUF805 domain-containing protein [Cognatishimia sp. MH4019]